VTPTAKTMNARADIHGSLELLSEEVFEGEVSLERLTNLSFPFRHEPEVESAALNAPHVFRHRPQLGRGRGRRHQSQRCRLGAAVDVRATGPSGRPPTSWGRGGR